jgi:hypothetical protein
MVLDWKTPHKARVALFYVISPSRVPGNSSISHPKSVIPLVGTATNSPEITTYVHKGKERLNVHCPSQPFESVQSFSTFNLYWRFESVHFQ